MWFGDGLWGGWGELGRDVLVGWGECILGL